MTIAEILEKHGIAVAGDKAKAFQADFNKEYKPVADFTAKEQEITTKAAEIAGLQTQITERNNDIKTLRAQKDNSDELNTKLSELQTKYNTDTQEFTRKIEEQRLEYAVEKFFSPVPFASELARKAAVAEFKDKKFKLEDGKFQGGEEFIAELKKADPAAFKTDGETKPPPDDGTPPPAAPLPQFAHPMNQPPSGGEKNPFDFQFNNLIRTPDNPAN